MSNEVRESMNGYIKIETHNLPSGLYTVQIQNATTLESKLFIIEQ